MFGGESMKKIFLLAFSQILIMSHVGYCACPTGYACMLKDLKQQEAVIQDIQKNSVYDYYRPKMSEPKLKQKEPGEIQPTYRDLLPYVPRYYLFEHE